VDVSPDLISRVTDGVLEELAEWQSRPLDRAQLLVVVANAPGGDVRMPRGGNNRMPAEVKRRYFELIRSGLSGSDASQRVGVSLSCSGAELWRRLDQEVASSPSLMIYETTSSPPPLNWRLSSS
jgi:Transposase, Mutator family